MRFLLRLLLLLVLSSFLLRHYGFFLRENLWHMHSAGNGELLNRLPGITKDHPQGGLAEANLPPGVLPRHDLTPGAMDPRVTQSNIREHHLSARLHGDCKTALRVHQCDETPSHAGLWG
jgi:hypothetical protein